MTSELKHEFAYYRDADGRQQKVPAYDLKKADVLALSRSQFLTDEDEQFRLVPRASDARTHHFYIKGSQGPRVFKGERSVEHDGRVKHLLSRLNEIGDEWQLRYKPSTDSHDVELVLPAYMWGKEVVRSVEAATAVRHDILGTKLSLATSYLRPTLVIEVIHTHYPEEEAFAGMLSQSARGPYRVVFDHTARSNYFLQTEHEGRFLAYGRYTWHIKDGAVWQGGKPAYPTITTSRELRDKLERFLANRS